MPRLFRFRHSAPLLLLSVLCVLRWANVLFFDRVLLPGEMLRGFAPFGSDPNAPWDILRFDALGQYFPWRFFAARELWQNRVPLWNPHQFAGTPFLANAQSAVFYPLSLPFYLFDTARAFAISALLHSLLACVSVYWLLSRWQLSRAASVVGAVAFGFCGYNAAWIALPTLSNTAAWLPLLLVLLERATKQFSARRVAALSAALCCTLLAGHAQVLVYGVFALLLRALFLPRRAWLALGIAGAGAMILGAAQILPTLELVRLGHRSAGGGATPGSWAFVQAHALQSIELPSLLVPGWPMLQGSFNENFGYVGIGVALLALLAVVATLAVVKKPEARREGKPVFFALTLTLFGLLYALGTPLAQALYFGVPGLAQMGGVARALVLWNLGAALLAAFGVDALRARIKSPIVPVVALLVVGAELFGNGYGVSPSSPRASIYPQTQLTTWLHKHTPNGERVLFVTPQRTWDRTEALQAVLGRTHPIGVLPPNGATVYGLNDVSGYDSLSSLRYREFVTEGQPRTRSQPNGAVSPDANGNMILLQTPSNALHELGVRYVVVPGENAPNALVSLEGASVLTGPASAATPPGTMLKSGADFYPGWKNKRYQPETFKLGVFLSLCAVAFIAGILSATRNHSQKDNS